MPIYRQNTDTNQQEEWDPFTNEWVTPDPDIASHYTNSTLNPKDFPNSQYVNGELNPYYNPPIDFNQPTNSGTEPEHIPTAPVEPVISEGRRVLNAVIKILNDWPVEGIGKLIQRSGYTTAKILTLLGAGGLSAWGAWRFFVGIPLEFLEYGALIAAFMFFEGSVYLLRRETFCEYLSTFGIIPIVGEIVHFFCDVLVEFFRGFYNMFGGIFGFFGHPSLKNFWKAAKAIFQGPIVDGEATVGRGAWQGFKDAINHLLRPASVLKSEQTSVPQKTKVKEVKPHKNK